MPLSAAGDAVGSLAGKGTEGRIMGGNTARTVAKVVYNRNISMFGSYHVGLIESLVNAVKDTTKGSDWTFGKESNETRARGIDKLAMLALLGIVIYPWLDKVAASITGNANTYITRSGVAKYPYLMYKLATGRTNLTTAMEGVLTPAVGTQTALELFFNKDLFTGNDIYGLSGEGLGGYLVEKVAPLAEAQKIAKGNATPGEFAASFLGVHVPKNTQLASDMNALIYDQKPRVLTEMKAHIAAGDTIGAQTIGHEFNVKLADYIRKADIAGGNSGSDARVAYFLNQYGAKMPGKTAMDNYTAKQGQNIVQKTLPNGKPVIVKDTPIPATGVIGAITTYAKALAIDPITAFKDIFTGQHIRQVTNGTIIVTRMALADSQAAKSDLGGGTIPKGMILDHVVSLESGGDNSPENLQLVNTALAAQDDKIENFLGASLKNGTLTGPQAREIEIRFKAGQGEPLTASILSEYNTKYNGQPLTLSDLETQYGYTP